MIENTQIGYHMQQERSKCREHAFNSPTPHGRHSNAPDVLEESNDISVGWVKLHTESSQTKLSCELPTWQMCQDCMESIQKPLPGSDVSLGGKVCRKFGPLHPDRILQGKICTLSGWIHFGTDQLDTGSTPGSHTVQELYNSYTQVEL